MSASGTMETPMADFDRSGPESDIKDRFYRYFQDACTETQERISQLESYSLIGGERKDAVDHLVAGISKLSAEVADLTGFIPTYDQRIYSQAIKALSDKLQETQAKFDPKPKFQFKTFHRNESAISIGDAAELAAQRRRGFKSSASNDSSIVPSPAPIPTPPDEASSKDSPGGLPSFPKDYNEELASSSSGAARKPSFSNAPNINISGHKGLHIILPPSAGHATASGSLTKLERCIVDMSSPTANGGPFAGLALKNIKDSLIIAGHVAGAAHITGVHDSVIVVQSRQVRMHDCKNVDIYLHCSSRPIIEDCSNIRFAPIPECHKSTSAKSIENQWDQVDDFKWLKEEHSPNWSILPEEQRIKEEVWTSFIPGSPGVGLDDIMKKIGIVGH